MREIPLTKGYVALVDDCEYERVIGAGPWYARVQRKLVYAHRAVDSTTQLLHRFILGLEPNKPIVDHIDRNGLNNCRSNLRVCTQGENLRNQGKHSNNTSGYKAVWWHAHAKQFTAQILINGKHISLGYFPFPEIAALEYDKAARELHGEFASLNFPAQQQAA